MSEVTVMVNKLAQGLLPMDDGLEWFMRRTESENRALLRELGILVLQAGATVDDVPVSIANSGIRPTDTPAVLASKGRLKEQLAKVGNLPEREFVKAFRLLVALLGVADERRRVHDRIAGCSHWWHHLGDPGSV
jgi:hypothetical protein